jgi:hypothetical protein
MEKEFIPYEQALALKELGFYEPCFFTYNIWNTEKLNNSYYNYVNHNNKNYNSELVSAPLYQQVFRWFREEYNFDSYIRPNIVIDIPKTYQFNINDNTDDTWYETYLEAELECLNKLIEIVKTK